MATGRRDGMRLWLGPVAGVAAIVILIVGYLMVTHHKPSTPVSFLGVTVSEMTSLNLDAQGKTLSLFQVADQSTNSTTWNIGSATGSAADQTLTQSFASSLATLQPTRTLTAAPTAAQLKEYGLNPPNASVTIALSGGRAPVTVNIGVASPVGGYYAQVAGKPAVYMISSTVPTEIKTTPSAWLTPPSSTSASGSASGASLTSVG